MKLRRLAEGGFSEVFLVREADGEQQYALKRMVCQTPASKADAKAELKILKVVCSRMKEDCMSLRLIYLSFVFSLRR